MLPVLVAVIQLAAAAAAVVAAVAVVVAVAVLVVGDPVLPMPVLLPCTGVPVAVPRIPSADRQSGDRHFSTETQHTIIIIRGQTILSLPSSLQRRISNMCIYIYILLEDLCYIGRSSIDP